MVPVWAYAPHSLDFRGVYENTDLYHKIMNVLAKIIHKKVKAHLQSRSGL
ncbi:MAG: hypothetical protein QM669_01520 [Siphonobacter sp.]